MKKITTVCARDCYDTCSLIVSLDRQEQIVSIEGDPNHPITQGFVCPRGAKDHENLRTNRVKSPFLRQGKILVETSWNDALDLTAKRLHEVLEQYGPEAVLYLDYAGNMGLLTGAFPSQLWNALGATQTDHALCSKSGARGLELHYGKRYGVQPEELPAQKLIVFWGFNPAVSAPHIWKLAKRARTINEATLVVVDPIHTLSAKQADLWIRPRPGSDVALAYGLMNYLIQQDHADRNFLEEWTTGFEELKAEAQQWTAERVAEIAGVSWQQIEEFGTLYANSAPHATMIGIGMQKRAHGADQVRAVSFIPTLLGEHRGFFYSSSDSFLVDGDYISGKTLTTKPSLTVPQVALADLIKEGRFKFIYVNCMNPAATLPNQQALREGFERGDVFLVVHETHQTKTTQYADVVLPAPTYFEKDDLVVPWAHNFVRYSPQAIAPTTDSRRETWVMRELATRLNLKESWLYDDPWDVLETAFQNALENGTFSELKSGDLLRLQCGQRASYPTLSGKIELFSSIAQEQGFSPLPQQKEIEMKEEHFVLLSSAVPQYTHSQFQGVYGEIPSYIHIHSRDAHTHDIQHGETVFLSNELGSVQVTARISDSVPEGVLWSPRLFEDAAGMPHNGLTSSQPQEIGKGPRFNSTTVRLTKP